MKRIAVIGSGYVGLVSGAAFAAAGHDVTAIDRDAARIASLQAGTIPIFEPGLDALVREAVDAGRLSFGTDLTTAVAAADIVILAVGTPPDATGAADLTTLHTAIEAIAPAVRDDAVFVIKSTVPVGTGDMVEQLVRAIRPQSAVAVVSNPEFLREGAAIHDIHHPDRIVIGTNDPSARDVMTALYRPLGADLPLFFTSRRSAELLKYAANAFLAMKVSFINEIADLCEATGADVTDIARGMGLDPRIGARFLEPGPGFGGSCFPKDTQALAAIGQAHAAPQTLVEATIAANARRRSGLAQRVIAACGGTVAKRTVAVLGLTFKPDTDDLRESPALDLIDGLRAAGAKIRAHDPKGMRADHPGLAGTIFCTDASSAAEAADCLVIATEWEDYRQLDLAGLATRMAVPRLVDLRNVFSRREAEAAGFAYRDIGRGGSAHTPLPRLAAE